MAADPKRSQGARIERAAILSHVRRKKRKWQGKALTTPNDAARVLGEVEDWILKRRQRYEPKPGGLGRR
jgi:hypothetical protein